MGLIPPQMSIEGPVGLATRHTNDTGTLFVGMHLIAPAGVFGVRTNTETD